MDANDIKLVKLLRRGWSATPLGIAHSSAASLDVYICYIYIALYQLQILAYTYIGKYWS